MLISHVFRLWFLAAACSLIVVAGRSEEPTPIDIEDARLEEFLEPSESNKKDAESWLLELQLVPSIANKIAIQATGTYIVGGKLRGVDEVAASQFAYCWCIDNVNDRERILFRGQSILNPEVREGSNTRIMFSNSSARDLLKVDGGYIETADDTAPVTQRESHVEPILRRSGVFFPTHAVVNPVTATYSGRSFDKEFSDLIPERLEGVKRIRDTTLVLFVFHPAPSYFYFKVLAFKDGVPIEVMNWLAFRKLRIDSDGVAHPAATTDEELREEMIELRQTAVLSSRSYVRWGKVGAHSVPVSIKGSTVTSPHSVELDAQFEWRFNEDVSDQAFAVESVGQAGPFSFFNK